MQGIERPLRQITDLSAHEVRTNLLFTMSNRTSGEPRSSPQTFIRMTFVSSLLDTSARSAGSSRTATTPSGLREWWSRTGSNRRHPACKAGALPAELRPLIVPSRCRGDPTILADCEVVGLGGLEPPTSRLSSARSNQLSYRPMSVLARARALLCDLERKRNEDGYVPQMDL